MCLRCVPHLLGSSWGRTWESHRELVEISEEHTTAMPHSFARESFVWDLRHVVGYHTPAHSRVWFLSLVALSLHQLSICTACL